MSKGDWVGRFLLGIMAICFLSIVLLGTIVVITSDKDVKAKNLYERQQDRYEQVYSQCLARESISEDRCHDIAICTVWGCDGR